MTHMTWVQSRGRFVAGATIVGVLVSSSLAAAVVILAAAAGASAARSVPSSIAALGASADTGFATAGAFDEAPANSWVTGTNPAVRSIYLRLCEHNPAIAGHAYNYAEPGSGVGELTDQAAHVPRGTELVTIETGVNDACESRTSPAVFRAQFERALRVVETRAPSARVVVLSIFDVLAMWDAVKALPAATFARNLCISATDRDRPELARTIRNLNRQLASVCARHPNCRYDGGAVYRLRWRRQDISTVDYFHPSRTGQRNIATAMWATGLFVR
jgi:lysophospholipase L1-like esterase